MAPKTYGLTLLALVLLASCTSPKSEHPQPQHPDLLTLLNKDSLTTGAKLDAALKADAEIADSFQLQLKKKIATLYLDTGNKEQAIVYYRRAAAVASKLKDSATWAAMLNNTGFVYDEDLKIDSAIGYYEQANDLFRITGDSLHYAQGLINLSISYRTLGDYNQSLRLGIQASGLLESLGEQEFLPDAYTSVANTLKNLGKLQDALSYHQKALHQRERNKDSVGIAGSLNNIGNIQRNRRQYSEARQSYLAALAIKRKNGKPKSIAITMDNIAETYFEQKQYAAAKYYFDEALALRRSAQDKDGTITTLHRLATLQLETRNIAGAKRTAMEATALLPGAPYLKQRYDNASLLSSIYRASGQYEQALDYASLSLNLKDSLFNEQLAQSVSETQVKYETEKKTRELVFARQLQQEQATQISEKNKYILFLTSLTILLLIACYFIFRLSRQTKKSKEHIELLMTELNHRVGNSLQTIIEIYNLQLAQTDNAEYIALVTANKQRILAMGIIHKLFNSGQFYKMVNMQQFLHELIKSLCIFHRSNPQDFFMEIQSTKLPVEKAITSGLIINEIITNIYKHARPAGNPIQINIALQREDNGNHTLTLEDNCGHWEIDTQRKGLGLFIMEKLTDKLPGSMAIIKAGPGMRYTINIKK